MTTPKLDDVWTTRDFPVLVEVARRTDQGEQMPAGRDVADALDMPIDQLNLAGAALQRRGLLDLVSTKTEPARNFKHLSGEAYFLTGLHPSGDDAVSALVSALRQAADQVDDPAEKTRLRALADGALGIGRDVLGGVLTAIATQGLT